MIWRYNYRHHAVALTFCCSRCSPPDSPSSPEKEQILITHDTVLSTSVVGIIVVAVLSTSVVVIMIVVATSVGLALQRRTGCGEFNSNVPTLRLVGYGLSLEACGLGFAVSGFWFEVYGLWFVGGASPGDQQRETLATAQAEDRTLRTSQWGVVACATIISCRFKHTV